MAIIYTYPIKTNPALGDTVTITDSESEDPEDKTKQASIASIVALASGGVGGNGTAGLIPVWLNSNTLTDSVYSFPTTVGTEGQVLALPTPIGTSPYTLVWVDNEGGGTFNGTAASGSPVAAAASPLATGAVV